MSYATGTTHYNLPQTVGTDKRDWADTNQAFSDIDAAIYGAVSDVATAGTAISGLETRMTTAEGNITDNAANITSLDTRMTTAEGAITSLGSRVDDVGNDLGDMICAYNEPTATSTHDYDIGDYFRYNDVLYRATQQIVIGDTIVPDTNCTTTNVTSELLDIFSDIPSITELTEDVTELKSDVSDLKDVSPAYVSIYSHTFSTNDTFNTAINTTLSSVNLDSTHDFILKVGNGSTIVQLYRYIGYLANGYYSFSRTNFENGALKTFSIDFNPSISGSGGFVNNETHVETNNLNENSIHWEVLRSKFTI